MAAQRVAIIGAGASGLCALKCCLDEGLVPTCSRGVGIAGGSGALRQLHLREGAGCRDGCYDHPWLNPAPLGEVPGREERPEEGRASGRYRSVINTSKEMMCFSDFPIPSDFPNYMHNSKIMEYFRMYARRFDLLRHIRFMVFLSTKRGTWVPHWVADGGYLLDFSYISHFIQLLQSLLPQNTSSFLLERKVNSRFDHTLYGLQPQHQILHQHPTINDDLPNRIISGRVLVKPNIQEFTETSAIFEDGTREDIDAVVFTTGYSFSFPFLEGCVEVVENQIPLYKFMLPPDLEKPTLAFTGLIQPLGATMPMSELQCRWATRVFKGLQDLLPSANMLADIMQTKEKMAKRYVKSQRHTIQVDYIPYVDELAYQVGVKPNLLTLFLTDPKLALEVAFGPCMPYQYRLRGPGEWAGAREAILTQWQCVVRPLQTRAGDRPSSSPVPHIFKVFFSIGLIVATLVYVLLSP
ncbi:LOW QUALITY PROTEIN: flavin-containing monooxygenase 5-like [Ciconia maguari]